MQAMPSAMRRSTFSRKTTHAITAVNTPSAFSNSDALDAGSAARPVISNTGPTTPPASVAAASQPHSERDGRTGVARRRRRTVHSPRPEPR